MTQENKIPKKILRLLKSYNKIKIKPNPNVLREVDKSIYR